MTRRYCSYLDQPCELDCGEDDDCREAVLAFESELELLDIALNEEACRESGADS